MLNVSQVQLQLVIRRCVIPAVHLRVAGESCLHAGTERKFRHFPEILPDDLGPLRPRADERHLSAENIDELRQLINPALADKTAHRRDARILL